MSQGSSRRTRIEHALRDVLTDAIAHDIKDPRVRAAALITVTKVELNVDLAVARVYVSVQGGNPEPVIAGLVKAAGFLRGPVARELNLAHAPELRFLLDESIDMTEKLASIVREDEERARAAGRTAGEPAPSSDKEPE
ncbi:MAG: 30S ribosome-binding factor RbfA [Kofleriaceae bacterium]